MPCISRFKLLRSDTRLAQNEAYHTEGRGMLHGFLGFMGVAPAARVPSDAHATDAVSYTHLRAHETEADL
eukprot:2362118-Rhodomonas_salina.1